MCFRFSALLVAAAGLAMGQARVLRVCAEPDNMPFSNRAGEGFENRMAELVARDLGARVEYTWAVRNALKEHLCDVAMGVPAAMDEILTTNPWYASTYVFVSRADKGPAVASLNDERLSNWRIGIQVVGSDYAPPGYALARRGLSANLIGFGLSGKKSELIDTVARGDVDVAIVWGPQAGYFARRAAQPLEIRAVSPAMFMGVPFAYEIALGVQKGNNALRDELNKVLARECAAAGKILKDYGVPTTEGGKPLCDTDASPRSVSLR